jgi:mRNA interferase MazF
MSTPTRGDVYRANLEPVQGSEQGGPHRPVVVISRDAINNSSQIVIVVPATDYNNKKRLYPSQVAVNAGEGGLTMLSVLLCEQVRAINKGRLTEYMGHLKPATMAKLEAALRITLDLH